MRSGRGLAQRVQSMHRPSPRRQMVAVADYYRPSGCVFHGLICVCLLPNSHSISAKLPNATTGSHQEISFIHLPLTQISGIVQG